MTARKCSKFVLTIEPDSKFTAQADGETIEDISSFYITHDGEDHVSEIELCRAKPDGFVDVVCVLVVDP